jgi:hypothetical protein
MNLRSITCPLCVAVVCAAVLLGMSTNGLAAGDARMNRNAGVNTSVPPMIPSEPATLTLFGVGLFAAGVVARRRDRRVRVTD